MHVIRYAGLVFGRICHGPDAESLADQIVDLIRTCSQGRRGRRTRALAR